MAQCTSLDNEKPEETKKTNEQMCYHKKIKLKRKKKTLKGIFGFYFAGCTSNMPSALSNTSYEGKGNPFKFVG